MRSRDDLIAAEALMYLEAILSDSFGTDSMPISAILIASFLALPGHG